MVRKRKVAVVVDSSSCLPRELLDRWEIAVVPHELIIGDKAFKDGVDIVPAEFYQLLQQNHHIPTTSFPTPEGFLDAFQSASALAESIVCLTLSATFSSTFDSAVLAARLAESELPGCYIKVVDTKAAAGAEGLIALEAAKEAMGGAELDQVTEKIEELIPKVNLLAFLDTLYYLRKGGRVPRVAAWAGSILGIKPLTELRLGEARLLEKPRSRARAMDLLVSLTQGRVEGRPVHVNVMHAQVADDAQRLCQRMEMEFNCQELFISEFTPVMGAHLGPGLLGLAFYADE